jgi:hypothetical protein
VEYHTLFREVDVVFLYDDALSSTLRAAIEFFRKVDVVFL